QELRERIGHVDHNAVIARNRVHPRGRVRRLHKQEDRTNLGRNRQYIRAPATPGSLCWLKGQRQRRPPGQEATISLPCSSDLLRRRKHSVIWPTWRARRQRAPRLQGRWEPHAFAGLAIAISAVLAEEGGSGDGGTTL